MREPKADQRLIEGIKRLRNSSDFQLLTQHMQQLLEHRKHLLVVTPAAEVPIMQGRARELQDILELLAKDKI